MLMRAEGIARRSPTPVEIPGRAFRRAQRFKHCLVVSIRAIFTVALVHAATGSDKQACRPVGVVDFSSNPASFAFIARRKNLSRGQMNTSTRIVSRNSSLRKKPSRTTIRVAVWNIGRQPRLFAGFDVLDLEVAAIGHDIDILDIENGAAGSAVSFSRPMSTT